MQPTADFDPVKTSKSLIRSAKQGALATLTVSGGDPYCSLVNVATAADSSPLLLISGLAVHTKNLLADPRVSLMLDERRAGDPLEGARVMISGRAEKVTEPAALAAARRRYLTRHPAAAQFVDFPDFAFFRIAVREVHLVAGFGRIHTLDAARILTEVGDAAEVLEGEAGAVEHMNDDHMDANALYATKLLGAADGDWRITGLDPEGADLALGDASLRLTFPERVTTMMALQKSLVKLVGVARAQPSESPQN
ncbi:MAG: pyridoxamine 5'-phosphate oxidase family protein [Xanthobacteraceae bacterium]